MRWLLAPATFTTLLLAIPSRGAGHIWLRNHPFDLPMTAQIAAVMVAPACLYLGWRKAKILAGLIGAALAGIAVAGGFFLAQPFLGRQAVWVAWLSGWLVLSVLQSFLDGHLEAGRAIRRGAIAAVLGAIGLIVVLAQHSADALPQNLPVLAGLLAWAVAYAPGATLLMRR